MQRTMIFIVSLFTLLLSYGCHAQTETEPMLVEKNSFTFADYTTLGGEVIPEVTIGWESYGELNADKDNVILITHFFSGNSHAAGKYAADDVLPGYWDAIIGPGKAIDTNKYFVISSDTLVNAFPHDPNVITTGPASINPATGKPYGLDFPVVTIRDFVNVQYELLQSMGITKLHAVVGASMGSLQALEWSIAYPDKVERMVSVIGAGAMDAWTIMALEHWARPIRHDPNWNNGDYYDGEAPLTGITSTLAMITQQAMHPVIMNLRAPKPEVLPQAALESVTNSTPVLDYLFASSATRAPLADGNHLLYLVRANQLFVAGHNNDLASGLAKVKAKTLFLPATNDLLLQPYLAKQAVTELERQGKAPQYEEIEGVWGHLDGLFSIPSKAATLKAFIEE
ncbi:E22 family MetX-like putative esterase [Pseudidiomarina terrestris]|uniref:Probable acyltransferase n=1 Tax=Pseudidiomarina terrestris TaxID=2820060 RepID=A0AAW7QY56_9GAMM|nr:MULTISPECIES: homoserine O-acetyltransferase [unclassified Pseudidiomarina]MDN7125165.1 homoserine O-acetyltransferase [Pseudidiomarina sp. 1APP75-32.1]MDN7136092.1 homoserine O-acetyltransferase [Pseudidiomarina sp. 1ASP75-5]